jgi:hypothetical protein
VQDPVALVAVHFFAQKSLAKAREFFPTYGDCESCMSWEVVGWPDEPASPEDTEERPHTSGGEACDYCLSFRADGGARTAARGLRPPF